MFKILFSIFTGTLASLWLMLIQTRRHLLMRAACHALWAANPISAPMRL